MTSSTQRKFLESVVPAEARSSLLAVHCMNPGCRSKFSDTYYVDSLEAPCPGCGDKGILYPCNAVHMLVESLAGPLHSAITGKRYNYACSLARKAYNHGLKHPGFPIHHSLVPSAVNCPECLKQVGFALTSMQQFTNQAERSIIDRLGSMGS